MKRTIFLAAGLLFLPVARSAEKKRQVEAPSHQSLTLAGAISIALKQNPDIRKALHEIERTRGQVIEVGAQALPQVTATSTYSQQDPDLLRSVSGGSSSNSGSGSQVLSGSTFGQEHSWTISIQATQLVYSGGQVKAAVKIAKLAEDSTYQVLRETVAQVVANVRSQFSTVLLDRDLITVAEESIKLLGDQLADQQNRLAAGTVPRFNVLQAEVALANAQPDLIRARNNHLIARLTLAKTLGFDAMHEVDVNGELRAVTRDLSLSRALASARERRAILKAQKNTIASDQEQITVAAAGYKPRLQASAGYEMTNARGTSHLSEQVNGWFVGATGTWNVFDGYQTKGKIEQAKAQLASARVNLADAEQQVELEVQKAFASVNQAKELIASQAKVVEQADEALRLAKERLAAGAGTQLDVLSAQVARTQARTTQKQALSDYNVAIAEFDRSTGAETIYDDFFVDPRVQRSKTALRRGRAGLRPAD